MNFDLDMYLHAHLAMVLLKPLKYCTSRRIYSKFEGIRFIFGEIVH